MNIFCLWQEFSFILWYLWVNKFLMVISLKTGFPHYLKIEYAYETFHKLKWSKAKKQLSYSAFFLLEKKGTNVHFHKSKVFCKEDF